MLNLVQNYIPTAKEIEPTIICSKMQWKNIDREEAIKKDCAERNKLSKPFGNNNKYVWVGIGVATMRS